MYDEITRARFPLGRRVKFPPNGEEYWLEIEEKVCKVAEQFVKEVEKEVRLSLTRHIDEPIWFLKGSVEKGKIERIQIALEGEPGRFSLSIVPDVILLKKDGAAFALPIVEPMQIQSVRLKGISEGELLSADEQVELKEKLYKALEYMEWLRVEPESNFSIRLPTGYEIS